MGIAIGVLILGLAAWIFIRRGVAFVKTGGRSGCAHCPYSGTCAGGSCARPKKKGAKKQP